MAIMVYASVSWQAAKTASGRAWPKHRQLREPAGDMLNPATLIQFATGAGIAGLASGLVWLLAFFRCRAREENPPLQTRAELTAIIDQHGKEFSARLVEVSRKLESLEAQVSGAVPVLRSGIGRNHRSRAIQLL